MKSRKTDRTVPNWIFGIRTFLAVQKTLLLAASCFLLSTISYAQCVGSAAQNQVNNGNFSSGNTGFTSGYSNCSTSNCLFPEGRYSIGTNATYFHSHFVGTDHTTGSGNFMVVNGTGVPNTIVWRQTINVIANTDYQFSAWVRDMLGFDGNPARLQFAINGVTQGAIFTAANSTNAGWQNFFVTWNSGAGTSAVITILNQNTALSGNDFGIDDISFVEVCPTPQPNLGPDRSICGVGSLTLNTNIPATGTTLVVWNDGLTGTGFGAPYTRNVTAPGTYSVCVKNGTCVKKDTIVITGDFSVNLGPDQILCTQTSLTLNPGYSNGLTTFVWYKDNVVIPGENNPTLFVSTPGLYRVHVTDNGCSTMRSDEVLVETRTAIPNDNTFCPPGAANLSVTPNPTGGFKWWDTPTKDNLLHTGTNYSPTPGSTTTYYVEDTTGFSYNVGPSTKFQSGFAQTGGQIYYIAFNAHRAFTLEAVTVFAKIYNPNENVTVGITLRDASGTFITQVLRNLQGPPIVPIGNDWPFYVPVGINIPIGNGFRLSNEGSVGDYFWASGSTPVANVVDWNAYKIPSIVTLTGLDAGYNYANCNCYGYFYNWVVRAGNNCGMIPVRATVNCPLPLDFLSFEATRKEQHVALNWVVGSEKNTGYFAVQRSEDGTHFSNIGYVPASGFTSENKSYAFLDQQPLNGTSYYRIISYDRDDQQNVSPMRTVRIANTANIKVSPNPCNAAITVEVESPVASQSFRLLNSLGTHLSQVSFRKLSDKEWMCQTELLASGVYFLEVETDGAREVRKVIKE